jgi:signal transduction histidine kinase
VLSPSLFASAETRMFRMENDRFLCNKEAVEVYWNPEGPTLAAKAKGMKEPPRSKSDSPVEQPAESKADDFTVSCVFATKSGKVTCPNPNPIAPKQEEAEFRHLVGDCSEGTMARFLQNKLKLLFWFRPPRDCQLVFGAQVHLPRLVKDVEHLFQVDPDLQKQITVALIDDTERPRLTSNPRFAGTWKRPFVSAQIGEVLPHWEIGVYLNNPARLSESARAFRLTLGLLISVLLLAIAIGSWLIVSDLQRQLALSRQKTDFVSNVSHELKTPLTSIRMFSELLAEGRVQDEKRRRDYLGIISAETARLSRLINNVLDFARMERGEKKYRFDQCNLVQLVRETVESYRPHLEASGFEVNCDLPAEAVDVSGDCDALAQVLVNLLSNAEKYSAESKEIAVRIETSSQRALIHVLDRGIGVPPGCEEKIFEQFYRAHDSLGSGIQGSGLGLTLARQIARAHGGDVTCQQREGGGSCFTFNLPLLPQTAADNDERP